MNEDNGIAPEAYFSPCFLSRLTDNEPHVRTEQYFRSATISHLKEDILRNIEMILNSKSRLSDNELGRDKELLNSVLGFGLFDFCGETKSFAVTEKLKINIMKQLIYFEPRINSSSLDIKLLEGSDLFHHIREMEISVVIDAASLNIGLTFLSRIDFETGGVSVRFAK